MRAWCSDRVTDGDERDARGHVSLVGRRGDGRKRAVRPARRSLRESHARQRHLWIAIVNFCALPVDLHPCVERRHCPVRSGGICGWGLIVPQQHRLVEISPHAAPLVLALNNTATYIGLACSAVLGGPDPVDRRRHYLSVVAAGLIAIAFVLAEAAHRCMQRPPIQNRALANRGTEAG